jgi:hypothetical protein
LIYRNVVQQIRLVILFSDNILHPQISKVKYMFTIVIISPAYQYPSGQL